jgi:hypothetical protein
LCEKAAAETKKASLTHCAYSERLTAGQIVEAINKLDLINKRTIILMFAQINLFIFKIDRRVNGDYI